MRLRRKRMETQTRLELMRLQENLEDLELQRERQRKSLRAAAEWERLRQDEMLQEEWLAAQAHAAQPPAPAALLDDGLLHPRWLWAPRSESEAATRIQCVWRGHRSRCLNPRPAAAHGPAPGGLPYLPRTGPGTGPTAVPVPHGYPLRLPPVWAGAAVVMAQPLPGPARPYAFEHRTLGPLPHQGPDEGHVKGRKGFARGPGAYPMAVEYPGHGL